MIPDPVIVMLVQENLDLACQAIEKAAMERAIADVDESFAPAYEARRRHRQVRKSMHRIIQVLYALFHRQTGVRCFGTARRLIPTSLKLYQILSGLNQAESSQTRSACMKTSVSKFDYLGTVHRFMFLEAGLDTKRRWASRPSSTMSYSRHDPLSSAMYPSSPVMDQPLTVPTVPSHQEAMDRFGVSGVYFYCTIHSHCSRLWSRS